MSDAVEIWEKPEARQLYMIAGWRQWADAGSVSSSLPRYLVRQTGARQIGAINPTGFYLFQIPGTHDLVRPVVKFTEGYPEALDTPRNELFYTGDSERGVVIFVGDEPHLDIERYATALLDAVEALGVQRIIGLGGVYGELPYDRERMVSSVYSKPELKDELSAFAVELSNYHGGASIGSYICRRAGERDIEYVAFYAMVPTYDLSNITQLGNSIRIENDFMAWLGVMRRINHMVKMDFDLSDLEEKSKHLLRLMDPKVEELDSVAPQLGVRAYLRRLSEEFTETTFDPLDDVWEAELRRLLDDNADDT
ncbi:MAG: PAC2 family protein [Anaerolineae bacterium]|nr:PAC2 family protein [Anaerolineae bacterium]